GLVVVVGCYAQLKPEEISCIEGVDLVLGAREKFNILSYLDDLQKSGQHATVHSCEIEEADFFIGSYSIETVPVLSLKCRMAAIINVPTVQSRWPAEYPVLIPLKM